MIGTKVTKIEVNQDPIAMMSLEHPSFLPSLLVY